jgi:hypothetical protein
MPPGSDLCPVAGAAAYSPGPRLLFALSGKATAFGSSHRRTFASLTKSKESGPKTARSSANAESWRFPRERASINVGARHSGKAEPQVDRNAHQAEPGRTLVQAP